jgi:lipoic acid synthetase
LTHTIPPWLKVNVNTEKISQLDEIFKSSGIETICWNADCPNICECYKKGTATFLLMGNICSRHCAFCGVTKGVPNPLNQNDIVNIEEAIKRLNLTYLVLTSVTRDDLPDGGAAYLRDAILEFKNKCELLVEVLIPDFKGDEKLLDKVISAKPAVLGHNLETVKRLYPFVRPEADYNRSLGVLAYIKEKDPYILTKSSILLGLGESETDLDRLFYDLSNVKLDILILCQYLQPSKDQLDVKEYIHPNKFRLLKIKALERGIKYVVADPLARTSYKAYEIYKKFKEPNFNAI